MLYCWIVGQFGQGATCQANGKRPLDGAWPRLLAVFLTTSRVSIEQHTPLQANDGFWGRLWATKSPWSLPDLGYPCAAWIPDQTNIFYCQTTGSQKVMLLPLTQSKIQATFHPPPNWVKGHAVFRENLSELSLNRKSSILFHRCYFRPTYVQLLFQQQEDDDEKAKEKPFPLLPSPDVHQLRSCAVLQGGSVNTPTGNDCFLNKMLL